MSLLQKRLKPNQAGIDEVGRGCLAGPVVAAAVILPENPVGLEKVKDSKKLSAKQRELAFDAIQKCAIAWAVGFVDSTMIDEINILNASKEAMIQAVRSLKVSPKHLLIDGNFAIDIDFPQTSIIGGDGISLPIAAASIMAKVSRDRWMIEIEKKYAGFTFSKHKGYGTKLHLSEIKANGLTPLHRRSFSPCRF